LEVAGHGAQFGGSRRQKLRKKNDLTHVSLTALPANRGANEFAGTQKFFIPARFRALHSQFASGAIEEYTGLPLSRQTKFPDFSLTFPD
jgi:hypothetical protein